MSTKALVCRCEDVTLSDVQHAISLGYRHIEEVKRYTGLGTGPCEGKECMAPCAILLAQPPLSAGDAAPGALPTAAVPFTARPPVVPVSLATLAGGADPDPAS